LADRAATGTELTDRLELLEADLQRFVEVASGEFGAERIIVFGSMARAMEEGAQALEEWSDLDLVVVAETEEPFYERIKHLRRLVRPKVGADVLVYTPMEWHQMKSERPFIKVEVLEKGKVVYEEVG
jgi:predicted nucleotidyltransferase